jgi:chromate reductase
MVKKIGIIVGSLRKDSFNRKTANTFVELLPEGYQADFLEIGDLPLYNEDLDVEGKIPESWTRFRTELKQVEGVFFFTPEYNRSMPASIKNALDVGSRPYGDSAWDGKPALVVSVSPGAVSGFGANHHLRQSLVFLNVPTLQQPEAYIGNVTNLLDDEGAFVEDTVGFFQLITDKYIDFFEKLTK